jgi:hypothetical protein
MLAALRYAQQARRVQRSPDEVQKAHRQRRTASEQVIGLAMRFTQRPGWNRASGQTITMIAIPGETIMKAFEKKTLRGNNKGKSSEHTNNTAHSSSSDRLPQRAGFKGILRQFTLFPAR